MKAILQKTDGLIAPLRTIAHKFASPFLDLAIRLYMAQIFFKSGWLKLQNHLNDDWGSTVFLFEETHPLPGIAPDMAAVMSTAGELFLPVLLAFGLFTRFGAAGLLIMTMTIQFLIPADYEIAHPTHYLWMLLLAVPLIKGPGPISIDRFIVKWLQKSK